MNKRQYRIERGLQFLMFTIAVISVYVFSNPVVALAMLVGVVASAMVFGRLRRRGRWFKPVQPPGRLLGLLAVVSVAALNLYSAVNEALAPVSGFYSLLVLFALGVWEYRYNFAHDDHS